MLSYSTPCYVFFFEIDRMIVTEENSHNLVPMSGLNYGVWINPRVNYDVTSRQSIAPYGERKNPLDSKLVSSITYPMLSVDSESYSNLVGQDGFEPSACSV